MRTTKLLAASALHKLLARERLVAVTARLAGVRKPTAVLLLALAATLEALAALAAERIEARPTWKPMHAQPLFAGSRMYAHDPALPPVCNRLFAEGICLPSGSGMRDAELARVVDCARRALAGARTRTHATA